LVRNRILEDEAEKEREEQFKRKLARRAYAGVASTYKNYFSRKAHADESDEVCSEIDENYLNNDVTRGSRQFKEKYSEAGLENVGKSLSFSYADNEEGNTGKTKANTFSPSFILEKSSKKRKKMIDLDNYLINNDASEENYDYREGGLYNERKPRDSDLSEKTYVEKPKYLRASKDLKNSSSLGGLLNVCSNYYLNICIGSFTKKEMTLEDKIREFQMKEKQRVAKEEEERKRILEEESLLLLFFNNLTKFILFLKY
jgi:hypothetical protein